MAWLRSINGMMSQSIWLTCNTCREHSVNIRISFLAVVGSVSELFICYSLHIDQHCVISFLHVSLCFCVGCVGEGHQEWRILQPVEGFHSVLRSPGAAHSPDLHLPGADEQVLQDLFPRFIGATCGWHKKDPFLQSQCVARLQTSFLLVLFYLTSLVEFVVIHTGSGALS